MKISELISRLTEIQQAEGDLPVLGGYLSDDSGLHAVHVLDKDGQELGWGRSEVAAGVYFQ